MTTATQHRYVMESPLNGFFAECWHLYDDGARCRRPRQDAVHFARGGVWLSNEEVEALARELHDEYQRIARAQNDVRHPDPYDELAEHIKEYDRGIARFVLTHFQRRHTT